MTLQEAAAKYARNTEGKAGKWFSATTAAGSTAYCNGLAKLGIPVAACQSGPGAHFTQGVQAAGAAGYQAGVAAKADKWARNFSAAFS